MTPNSRERAVNAARQAVPRVEVNSYEQAVMGKRVGDEFVFEVPGKPLEVWITKSGQPAIALNEAGVPHSGGLPIWVRLERNTLVIKGVNAGNQASFANLPPSPYGVPSHPHALSGLSDVVLTALADGQILAWDATAGKWVNVTEAGALVTSVNGETGAVVLDSDDIAEGATNLYASDANIAAAIDAAPDLDPPTDATLFSAVLAGVLRSVSYANLKTALTTLTDGLYTAINTAVLLTGNQDVGGIKTFSDGLKAETITAIDGDGLSLRDDGGNLGIFVDDGGNVGIRVTNPLGPAHIATSTTAPAYLGAVTSNTNKGAYLAGTQYDAGAEPEGWLLFGGFAAVAEHRMLFGGGASLLNAATNIRFYTAADVTTREGVERLRIDNAGRVGIGVTTMQGALHIHDGTTGHLVVSKTGIVGTAQTIVPNGTGDVITGVVIRGVAKNTTPGAAKVDTGLIVPGATEDVVIGADTLRFAVSAGGAVTVVRQAGSASWSVAITLTWL